MSQLDKELKALFKRQASRQRNAGRGGNKDCLTEYTLHRFLRKKLQTEELQVAEKHLMECYDCLELVAEASKVQEQYGKKEIHLAVDQMDLASAVKKRLPKKKNQKRGLKPKTKRWFFAACFTFLLSFLYPPFFIQYSVLTLIFGAKWVVESRSTKTIIAIREAWQRGDQKRTMELLEDIGRKR